MKVLTQPIEEEHYTSGASLLAKAFYDNPAHQYFCPNPDKRVAQLTWLLGANLNLQLSHGAKSFCLVERNNIQAMGYWTDPNLKISLVKKVRAGLLKAPAVLGPKNFLRMMEVSSHIENSILGLSLGRPHKYLNNMVVEERLRGKGLGSKILNQQIDLITKQDPKTFFSLTTQKPENVQFYEKHGFRVVREEHPKDGTGKFANWIMCRD